MQRRRTEAKLDLGRLPELIGYMLRRAQMVAFQDFFRAFAAADIRPAQYSVLTVIGHNPGLTQSRVSAALGIKRTNFVALLDSLESRGLAERRPAASDRRSHALHLTPAGRDLMRELDGLVDGLEQRLVARIGQDGRAQLLGLLHRLTDEVAEAPARPRRVRSAASQARPNRSLTSRGIG